MKTKRQNRKEIKNSSELLSRSEQLSGPENSNSQTTTAAPAPEAPAGTQPATAPETLNSQLSTLNSPKPTRPYINFAEREFNRTLSVDKVLERLSRWMPRQRELAQVVGSWIWITFPEPPIERVRAELSQLGFHWNHTRKCWQHPCGSSRLQSAPATTPTADQVAA